MNRQKTAGDRTEREAVALLTDQLGGTWRRKLGAGRKDDEGDIEGPDTIVQVARVLRITDLAAVTERKAHASVQQQARAGARHGLALIRATTPIGVIWRVAVTTEQALELGPIGIAAPPADGAWSDALTIAYLPAGPPAFVPVPTRSILVARLGVWATAWREA